MSKVIGVYRCKICNKDYASNSSLWNHNNKFHKIEVTQSKPLLMPGKPLVNQSKPLLKQSENINKCSFCNKILSCKQAKSRHHKICKEKTTQLSLIEETKALKEEIVEIKNELSSVLKSMKVHPKTLQKINNRLTNNTVNITNNITNNNNINITFVKFGNEQLSRLLSKKEMQMILSQCRSSLKESIKRVHFNDKRPEYKNILITNMRDNLAYIFNGDKFEAVSKDIILNDLLNGHLENIENYIDENELEDNFKNRHLTKFIKELNGDSINPDIPNYKIFTLNEIKKFVYNNSNPKILKKLNNLELKEKIIEYDNGE